MVKGWFMNGCMGALLKEASRNLSGTVRLEAVQVRKSQQSDDRWVVYNWMYGSPPTIR
jgi:hypothetical protein